jgi:hypothetical protein
MQLYKNEIPRVSVEYYQHLLKVFNTKEITPDTNINQIMMDVGIKKVLDYVERSIKGTEIIGNPDEVHTVSTIPNRSKLYKILNIFSKDI